MDVVLFEQHSGSSWIIKAVDWLFIQRAVEICEERVRRCCYSQGVPVADGQISAEFPGVLTEVFVSWHIRLHQTSSDFIRLHQTSSDFIRLHQTSSDFIRLHQTSSDFIRLHQTSSDFIRLHQTSSDFIRLHQTSSDFIRLHQTSSDFIRLHQTSSDFIRLHQTSSDFIRLHQASSGFIRLHQASSGFIRLHQASSGFIRLHQTSSDFIRLHQTSSDFIRLLAVLQDIHWPLRPKCHWSLALQKKQASPQARETSIIIYWWRSTFEVPIMFYRYIYTDERWLSYSDARHVELEDVDTDVLICSVGNK